MFRVIKGKEGEQGPSPSAGKGRGSVRRIPGQPIRKPEQSVLMQI